MANKYICQRKEKQQYISVGTVTIARLTHSPYTTKIDAQIDIHTLDMHNGDVVLPLCDAGLSVFQTEEKEDTGVQPGQPLRVSRSDVRSE